MVKVFSTLIARIFFLPAARLPLYSQDMPEADSTPAAFLQALHKYKALDGKVTL